MEAYILILSGFSEVLATQRVSIGSVFRGSIAENDLDRSQGQIARHFIICVVHFYIRLSGLSILNNLYEASS